MVFWEGKHLRGMGFLQLETYFQEHSFDDITLYLDENLTETRSGKISLFPAQ
ncbi:MAG: hypothetical protein LBG59_00335 [Candidatus Peribacteria bacterium]|nr:hypothetical protein [Candidatus Peribacteria bacterium]